MTRGQARMTTNVMPIPVNTFLSKAFPFEGYISRSLFSKNPEDPVDHNANQSPDKGAVEPDEL
jgi:hypothetical protein